MSFQSRVKLVVLGVIGLAQPVILMLVTFGLSISTESALAVQAVAASIGVIVLAALGISTQADPPNPPSISAE